MASIRTSEVKFLEELLHDITEVSTYLIKQDSSHIISDEQIIPYNYAAELIKSSKQLRLIIKRLNADVEHNRQKTREYIAKRRESDPFYARSESEIEQIKKREEKKPKKKKAKVNKK